jgi:hypothetical protein
VADNGMIEFKLTMYRSRFRGHAKGIST